jgi:electron transport protein HydN
MALKTERLNSFILADHEKCVGCRTCEIACAIAHAAKKPMTAGAADGPFFPRLFVMVTAEITAPVQCRHCEDAPCANVCQMHAISRVGDKVLVDTDRCIGCKLCLMACAFGAIELVPRPPDSQPIYANTLEKIEKIEKIKIKDRHGEPSFRANKCDLCTGRAEGPACVTSCPQKALELVNAVAETRKRKFEAALDLQETMQDFGV